MMKSLFTFSALLLLICCFVEANINVTCQTYNNILDCVSSGKLQGGWIDSPDSVCSLDYPVNMTWEADGVTDTGYTTKRTIIRGPKPKCTDNITTILNRVPDPGNSDYTWEVSGAGQKWSGNGKIATVSVPENGIYNCKFTVSPVSLFSQICPRPANITLTKNSTAYAIETDYLEASSLVADNASQQFEGHEIDNRDPCFNGAAVHKGPALVVYFKDVHGGYTAGGSELVADFDVELKAKILPQEVTQDELKESWSFVSGPNSGCLNKTEAFNVLFQNPKKGGVYRFKFDNGLNGCKPSGLTVVLPLAGAESADFVRQEYQRITDWVNQEITTIPVVKKVLGFVLIERMIDIARNFDYSPGDWEGGDSPCSIYSESGEETLTIEGIVISSSKLANIMWAVLFRKLQYSDKFSNFGADVRNRIDHGWKIGDTEAAKQSYELGRELAEDGIHTLYDKIRYYRDLIREPNSMAFKVWPSKEKLIVHPQRPNLP